LAKALNEQRLEYRPTLQEDTAFQSLWADPRFRELAGLLPHRAFMRDQGWH
jgi:hypothetical protein